jgi:hypothetical protein
MLANKTADTCNRHSFVTSRDLGHSPADSSEGLAPL